MSEEVLTAAAGVPHQSPAATASPGGSRDGGAGIATTRTLDMVTAEIKFLDAQAGRLVMGHALEIGRRLTEAKELVPYGGWGDYLEKELNYSQSTANKLMKVFQEFGASQMGLFGPEVESESFTNLTYSKALALLSVPREEREEFLREVDAEHLSTRELKEAIRERDEARKALEETREELHETSEMLDKTLDERNARGVIIREHEESLAAMEKELAELQARPVEVAVQEPDPEEIEKRAREIAQEEIDRQTAAASRKTDAAVKEREKAMKQLGDIKKKAEEEKNALERKLKEAEGKLAAAGEADRAEAEKLRAETEALRKQLAMSDAAITTAKVHFASWQEAYRKLIDAANAAPGEARDKLRAAIRAQARAWEEEAAE